MTPERSKDERQSGSGQLNLQPFAKHKYISLPQFDTAVCACNLAVNLMHQTSQT